MSPRPHGQMRQSQVVTTFGPGSMLDLPGYSVLVGGLDLWSREGRFEVIEPRLVEKLQIALGLPNLRLYAPPPEPDRPDAPTTGIPVWQFPEWFITQDVEDVRDSAGMRSRRLVPRAALTRGKFIDADRCVRAVVPVRFVRACPRGHIGDIDWRAFVHGGKSQCTRQLSMQERGTSGDLADVTIACECGANRAMTDAARSGADTLGNCDGSRPWLGLYSKEPCGAPSRLLLRSASNAYFPQLMSVISLPDRNGELVRRVSSVWEDFLQYIGDREELARDRRRKDKVRVALEGFTDEAVWEEIEARRQGRPRTTDRPVKVVEFEALTAAMEEVGEDVPDGDFHAHSLPGGAWAAPWTQGIDRVVLVHRLREVVAQVSFTRFEAISADTQGELSLGVQPAMLARELTWLPAIENRGEGVFLAFSRAAVSAWLDRPAVKARGKKLEDAFDAWHNEHHTSRRVFPGLPYIMLHSLSHLLLTSLALECGYPASSLRERVYAGDAGYGVLIFTASPDSEGTLGGLVEAGKGISRHLRAALQLGQLCSHDPVCAQHDPADKNEWRFLQGAACHGCLLIAETCCEQHNDFLDRALVVPTVASQGAEFFSVEALA
ncbi:MAG: DUF1998 domain-containing protein [Actinomycetota bacterium]|nr:DUF1998 domain-containing protein [Actinomycetota bacterium]